MRKIEVKEKSSGYYSKYEKYIGYFHEWVDNGNGLQALVEDENGDIYLEDFNFIRFIEKPEEK